MELLKKYQITLNVAVHHALTHNGGNVRIPQHVHLISPENISQIKGQTDLFITDYSSLAFDFMYLDIPVIFYHFDADFPYLNASNKSEAESAKSHDSELYNVFYNSAEVIRKIKYYILHDFKLEPENLLKNKDIFWDIKDNCATLYKKIQELDTTCPKHPG